MNNQPTYDDVNLILKLYEIRREDKMREARAWFIKFKASNMAEFSAIAPMGSPENAYFRMVVSYWDMAASFITAGVLNQELFLQSGNELLFTWAKVSDVLPEIRKTFGNPNFLGHVETVAKSAIARMNQGDPKAYEAFAARVKSM